MTASPQNGPSSSIIAAIILFLSGTFVLIISILSGATILSPASLILFIIGFASLHDHYKDKKNESSVRENNTFINGSSKLGGEIRVSKGCSSVYEYKPADNGSPYNDTGIMTKLSKKKKKKKDPGVYRYINCPYCGAINEDDDESCRSCKRKL